MNNFKKQLLLSIFLLISLVMWQPSHAQIVDTPKEDVNKYVLGDEFALPPFRAHVLTVLELPARLGGGSLKGNIKGICIADSLGKIFDIGMQEITLKNKRSNETVMRHEFHNEAINNQNKHKFPRKVRRYFKWWHKQAIDITKVHSVNREGKPGMVLSPPPRDTNYVMAVYQFR